jgi:hypothetical protein
MNCMSRPGRQSPIRQRPPSHFQKALLAADDSAIADGRLVSGPHEAGGCSRFSNHWPGASPASR